MQRLVHLILIGMLLPLGAGCNDFFQKKTPAPEKPFLLKIGQQRLSPKSFHKALSIYLTAYPYKGQPNPNEARTIKKRLLKDLKDEMLLMEVARVKDIHLSEAKLDETVQEIRKDYPEDTFETVLLKKAISIDAWRAQLRKRLLIEKVIDQELIASIPISPDELRDFFKEYKSLHPEIDDTLTKATPPNTTEKKESFQDLRETLIEQLKKQKAEALYPQWIETLKKNYPLEINQAEWEKILDT